MQVSIKKNRLKEIIKEEVENFKFIDVREQTTDSKIRSAIAEELKAVFESVDEGCATHEDEKLDEIVTDEIAKAVEEGFAKRLGPFSSYEDLDEGPFDAVKDKVGDLADKVTGKKRGARGFNAHGESLEDKYDKKIFGAWAARARAASFIYSQMADPNGKFFKTVLAHSLDSNKAKPVDFEKAFLGAMKADSRLRNMMREWSKNLEGAIYNLIPLRSVKELNSILKTNKGTSAEGTSGVRFYERLAEILSDMQERVGDNDYEEYLQNKFLRGQLRSRAERMLRPGKGRAGERAWKEFTAGSSFDPDGTGSDLSQALGDVVTAAELVADAFDEARSNPVDEQKEETNE